MQLRKRAKRIFRRMGVRTAKRAKNYLPVSQLDNLEGANDAVMVGVFSQEILDNNEAAARRYGVEATVHPEDFIYWFHVAHPLNKTVSGPIIHYFDEGSKSAHKLVTMMEAQGMGGEDKIQLLEFASGYGRVSRHLKRYPHLDLVCSDIHNKAVEFLTNRLGVKAFLSHSRPADFSCEEKFDVVFALSFFTHMPKDSFGPWLGVLYQTLKPGGRLIFTTHGYANLADVPGAEIPPDGFLFMEVSEQKDLDVQEYGVAITKPEYVMASIIEHTGSHNIVYKQANWDEKQDLWIVHRPQGIT